MLLHAYSGDREGRGPIEDVTDRGRITPGQAADLVVFDPATNDETPLAGDAPPGRPQGITHVFLNGAHVVRDGVRQPGERHGRVLQA